MNKILNTDNVNYVVASDTDSIYLKLINLLKKFVKINRHNKLQIL